MTAIKLAQDLAAAWELVRPERRKQLIAALFETVKVAGGRIVSVQPKAAVMPLVAVTMPASSLKDLKSSRQSWLTLASPSVGGAANRRCRNSFARR